MHRSTLLAERLGVSKRTKNRYDNAIPDLYKRPVYAEIPLYGSNLWHVLDQEMPAWVFLEDETGKRYPPLRGLAGKLIKQGKQIRLLRRLPNYYWVGQPSPHKTPTPLSQRAYADKNAYYDPRYLMVHWDDALHPVANASETPEMGTQGHENTQYDLLATPAQKTLPLPPAGEVEYHDARTPFADTEWEYIAQRIQERINTLGKGNIALHPIRRLLVHHGITAVWRAMVRTEIRQDVRNAPAFLVALVKSSGKAGEVAS